MTSSKDRWAALLDKMREEGYNTNLGNKDKLGSLIELEKIDSERNRLDFEIAKADRELELREKELEAKINADSTRYELDTNAQKLEERQIDAKFKELDIREKELEHAKVQSKRDYDVAKKGLAVSVGVAIIKAGADIFNNERTNREKRLESRESLAAYERQMEETRKFEEGEHIFKSKGLQQASKIPVFNNRK